MESYRTRRIISVVVGVIFVIIIIFGLVALFTGLFSANIPETVAKISTSKSNLKNTSADRSVKMTVRGPIVADENFRTYQITVSPSSRVFDVIQGYIGQSIKNITLTNNTPAYVQLVYALDRSKLMDNSELTGVNNDTRGICATGRLYEFEILQSGKSLKRLWTTSCPGNLGSLGASVSVVRNLFIKQVPGAESAIGNL